MATRERATIGDPCWVDHMSNDVEATRSFYTEVFGWEASEASQEFGGYFQFNRDGVPVAGAMPNMTGQVMPDQWSVYLAVEDADATLAKAQEAGATVVAPAMKVADLGTMAVMVDPSGAGIGIWAPDTFQGFGVLDEVGAPKWFELHSRDYAKAVAFYEQVFEWDTHVVGDTDELRYTTANHGNSQFAGMMDSSNFLPEGVPSHWRVYFGVSDVDATVAQVVDLGGVVQMAASDTPYGRLASVADPGGASFSVMNA
jgi:uncharacterized protein